MKNIREEVSKLTVTAVRVIGHERVNGILQAHSVDRVGDLTLALVDSFLRDLKRAVDEKLNCKPCEAPQAQTCGQPAPAQTVPAYVDFEPLHAAVREARKAIGDSDTDGILERFGNTLSVCIRVNDVNPTIVALRKAIAAATPTRKLLKEYIRRGYSDEGVNDSLEAFADWIDSRPSTTETTLNGEWTSTQRYSK